MSKTILITGATDGIGLEAAKALAADGHTLLLHGRNLEKLARARRVVSKVSGSGDIACFCADLSDFDAVEQLARDITDQCKTLDVLINNAGVFMTSDAITSDKLDSRFVVNTLSPYLLTHRLLALVPADGRIINLSSAAQATVDTNALQGNARLSHNAAYAQSKLAITMWSIHLARQLGSAGPSVIAVNPGSLLGSKMVQEAYGMAGHDLQIGADILYRAAVGDDFSGATGRYFDNDSGRFASPHADALDAHKTADVIGTLDALLATLGHPV
ncbi:MAG: SDR family NAD(P)-dependent oxidoreductase [Pseudomonadota bacterium]